MIIDEESPRYKNPKKWFIDHLKLFVARKGSAYVSKGREVGNRVWRGEVALAAGLVTYLERSSLPDDVMGVDWFYYLPKWIFGFAQDALHLPEFASFRTEYELEVERPFPDLFHLGDSYRYMTVSTLSYLLGKISGEEQLPEKVQAAFFAQDAVLNQAWWLFSEKAYRSIAPRIKEESHRSNEGIFGTTTFASYAMAGRVIYSFSRENREISFIADESDLYGIRTGMGNVSATFRECLDMIYDVTTNWDEKLFIPWKGK